MAEAHCHRPRGEPRWRHGESEEPVEWIVPQGTPTSLCGECVSPLGGTSRCPASSGAGPQLPHLPAGCAPVWPPQQSGKGPARTAGLHAWPPPAPAIGHISGRRHCSTGACAGRTGLRLCGGPPWHTGVVQQEGHACCALLERVSIQDPAPLHGMAWCGTLLGVGPTYLEALDGDAHVHRWQAVPGCRAPCTGQGREARCAASYARMSGGLCHVFSSLPV